MHGGHGQQLKKGCSDLRVNNPPKTGVSFGSFAGDQGDARIGEGSKEADASDPRYKQVSRMSVAELDESEARKRPTTVMEDLVPDPTFAKKVCMEEDSAVKQSDEMVGVTNQKWPETIK
ncbi:unnamed protein product [Linum trigynum]|uniref:Uncharacterized protein n=1 Tax=Linum trigynum TaxID=586398 RepID=A0AAV2G9P4_9ROSI